MKFSTSSAICLALMFPCQFIHGGEKEADLTNYQKALRGLARKDIRAGLSSEKMLDMCIPTSKRGLGQFTEYEFDLLPGYHGLTIIAKNGLLKRAIEWSCTNNQTYFNELTADDSKQYHKLCIDNVDTPRDKYIGRWGWERPPMRDWNGNE